MITLKAQDNYIAKNNTIAGVISLTDFVDVEIFSASSAWINTGGWQSWNPGFETEPGKKQAALKNKVIRAWNTWLTFPGTKYKPSKNLVLSQFITYFRWDNQYLLFISCNSLNNQLPPVQFIINRRQNTVTVELADKGKSWKKDDVIAEIEVYKANCYFEAKAFIESLFGSSNKKSQNYTNRFDQIQFLGQNALGWESWYNHYEKINESLILEDLSALATTENLIKVSSQSSQFQNPVFQIDDGYQLNLGDWEWNEKLFPSGPVAITEKITKAGYVPGLWIAPFIVDLRSNTACQHPDWLLRDKNGHLVPAGYNPRWGSNAIYYCWDLSKPEVLQFIDNLMDKAINTWGFRYLKLDFLYAGMLLGECKNGAAFEHFNKALSILTSRKQDKNGNPVTYLGCGNPMELSFNYFPLSRIGCDTLQHWESKLMKFIGWNGRTSAYLNMKDTLGRALWNKTVFANDPDVIFIRKENCSLTDEEKLLIATVNILFGSQIMYSDDPAKCTSPEEIELTNKIARIIELFKDEEFAVQQTASDVYKVWSKSGKYQGELSLVKNNHYVRGLYENL